MRNPPSQDCSPRRANSRANTNTSPKASRTPLGSNGFESTLPPEALYELLRRKLRTRQQSAQTRWCCPPWLKSLLTMLAPILALGVIGAILLVVMAVRQQHEAATPPPTPVPASPPPAVQSPQIYTEWVRRGSQAGFILCYGDCTPARSNFFRPDPAPRAQSAVPRAELVSMPVPRATLVEN
jgi:hypothetical protein